MPSHRPVPHFQKQQVEPALELDSPWHSTSGSPQKSSWHSRQVRPPKPGMHWHCPVNCQKNPNRRCDHLISSAPGKSEAQAIGARPALPSPRCRRARGNAQGHSRTAHSPCRWQASTCWGHSGRRSAPPHWGGTGTAPWLPRTDSSPGPRSPPGRCPGRCRRTL